MAKKTTIEQSPAVQSQEAGKQAAAQDHVPPQISGKDLMISFDNQQRINRRRKLEELIRIHNIQPSEIAALFKSKVKTPTAESPRIES